MPKTTKFQLGNVVMFTRDRAYAEVVEINDEFMWTFVDVRFLCYGNADPVTYTEAELRKKAVIVGDTGEFDRVDVEYQGA